MGRANEAVVRPTPSIGWSTLEHLRSRADALRETAGTLSPVAADAFERRARQLDNGVKLLEAVMRKESRSRSDVA